MLEQQRLYRERYAREVRGNHYSDDDAFGTYRELANLCFGLEDAVRAWKTISGLCRSVIHVHRRI